MRTVERFAFFFGIANLVLGIFSAIRSLSSSRKRSFFERILPMRRASIFDRSTTHMFGNFGAVNPPHAILHSALGAAGLATRPYSRMSRAYMWLNALMFGAMAVLGWATVGFKPGTRKVRGVALDRGDNIINTLWAIGSLLLAVKPNIGQRRIDDSVNRMVESGLRE